MNLYREETKGEERTRVYIYVYARTCIRAREEEGKSEHPGERKRERKRESNKSNERRKEMAGYPVVRMAG